MSRMSELHAALELVDELEGMGVARRHAVIQAADEWGFKEHDVETALNVKEKCEGGMTRYDLEIEAKLKDGRLVLIVGHVDMSESCQCHDGDSPHRHIGDVQVESVIQLFEVGALDGDEITPNSREYAEIEQIMEDWAYKEAA